MDLLPQTYQQGLLVLDVVEEFVVLSVSGLSTVMAVSSERFPSSRIKSLLATTSNI